MVEKCKAVLNGLTMENATGKSIDLLNLMHRYPTRVELITYVVTSTASSDMSVAESIATMIKHFETISKKSIKLLTSMVAYIGTFSTNGSTSQAWSLKNPPTPRTTPT